MHVYMSMSMSYMWTLALGAVHRAIYIHMHMQSAKMREGLCRLTQKSFLCDDSYVVLVCTSSRGLGILHAILRLSLAFFARTI